MKKVIVLIAISFATFGCTKEAPKMQAQKTSVTINAISEKDTIVVVEKKKGVCEGCSHQ